MLDSEVKTSEIRTFLDQIYEKGGSQDLSSLKDAEVLELADNFREGVLMATQYSMGQKKQRLRQCLNWLDYLFWTNSTL